MKDLQVDEKLKSLIRPLTKEEYARLEKSILSEGVRDPLVVWEGKDILLDGHHRYEIAQDHGVGFAIKEMEFEDRDDVKEWMIKNQLGRRNLTTYQKAELALELEPLLAEKAKEKQESEGKELGGNPTLSQNSAEGSMDTRDELAETAGVSHDTISKAKKIRDRADEETKEKLRSGEESINGAYKNIRKQEKAEELEAKKEEYQQQVTETPQAERAIDIFETDMRFRVFYADPPWSYRDKQNHPNLGGQIKHYDTLSIQDLCDMPISSLTEDDAVLFLWVTSPILPESFAVIEAWGFTYKASFVWDKVGHNMGHYNSVRHEFLMVCTRGSCTPDKKKLFDSVQSIEKTRKHSEKPEQFRDIIDTLYPHGNRIELFARTAESETWFYWGNEI